MVQIKAIIPAKCNSTRIPNKNWKNFYDGKCLVEIKINQLLKAGLVPFVFCEDKSKRKIVEDAGAEFVLRDIKTTKDSTNWSDVVTEFVSNVPCDMDDPLAFCLCCCPLFDSDQIKNVVKCWENLNNDYDCIITVKELQKFLLDENGRPLNFSFGKWHEWSQDLPKWYILESPIHIMKKKNYLHYNYYIGKKPYLYTISEQSIDIDTIDEFNLAQKYYINKLQ